MLGAFSSDTNTGCGSQHPPRFACVLLAAAPTAPPCFRHWRRSLLLQAIPSPALLPLAIGSHPSGRSSEKLPAVLPKELLLIRCSPTCENAFGAALRLRSNESPSGAFKQVSGLR